MQRYFVLLALLISTFVCNAETNYVEQTFLTHIDSVGKPNIVLVNTGDHRAPIEVQGLSDECIVDPGTDCLDRGVLEILCDLTRQPGKCVNDFNTYIQTVRLQELYEPNDCVSNIIDSVSLQVPPEMISLARFWTAEKLLVEHVEGLGLPPEETEYFYSVLFGTAADWGYSCSSRRSGAESITYDLVSQYPKSDMMCDLLEEMEKSYLDVKIPLYTVENPVTSGERLFMSMLDATGNEAACGGYTVTDVAVEAMKYTAALNDYSGATPQESLNGLYLLLVADRTVRLILASGESATIAQYAYLKAMGEYDHLESLMEEYSN